jgi:hypothetical protein
VADVLAGVEFAGAVTDAVLAGLALKGAVLSSVEVAVLVALTGVVLAGAVLAGACADAGVTGLAFTGAVLAEFTGAVAGLAVTAVVFAEVEFNGTVLAGAVLAGAVLAGVALAGVALARVEFTGVLTAFTPVATECASTGLGLCAGCDAAALLVSGEGVKEIDEGATPFPPSPFWSSIPFSASSNSSKIC